MTVLSTRTRTSRPSSRPLRTASSLRAPASTGC